MACYEMSANPYEGMSFYSPGFLEKQPRLASRIHLLDTQHGPQGQADDLKLETGGFRYWLARCGPEDGEQWQVHVERLTTAGRWKPVLSYREA